MRVCLVLGWLAVAGGCAQGAGASQASSRPDLRKTADVAYCPDAPVTSRYQTLDIYAPPHANNCPVMVMIHGGGWAIGDKASPGVAQLKSRYFVDRGFVFVSINYRLSPAVKHPAHVQDVAAAVAWLHSQVARYGGDPDRIFVMGHSAGAHLAALVATDDRRLGEYRKPLSTLKGVVLLDGAGYDVPAQMKAATGWAARMYRAAMTDDAQTQQDASPVTHVTAGKGIPPFFIMYVAGRQASAGQAQQLHRRLSDAGVSATLYAAEGKDHLSLNRQLGQPEDKPTQAMEKFLAGLLSNPSGGDGGPTGAGLPEPPARSGPAVTDRPGG